MTKDEKVWPRRVTVQEAEVRRKKKSGQPKKVWPREDMAREANVKESKGAEGWPTGQKGGQGRQESECNGSACNNCQLQWTNQVAGILTHV